MTAKFTLEQELDAFLSSVSPNERKCFVPRLTPSMYDSRGNLAERTKEFKNGDSRIPVVFACMFAGKHTGLYPNATEFAVDIMLKNGATPEKVDLWAQDAVVYLSVELKDKDMIKYWENNCAQQFAAMEKLLRTP